ncbi:hypothetical protein BRN33_01890 [Xanthomonas oryzae pv. oryzae]|nr:hypothetical protein BRN32_19480 [Xanthomonas oryzae pv. oryzae]RBJ37110.1 hypothetical protein BRN91_21390 [Xanthomonas oryzae pv. oryzae]RBL14600.1 hypothetical protein BRN33_01890 [Xanthomonas oryzae pv. oryzae]RBL22162.1 hypothetical protein BRN31_21980 [Xanthomonas oryzae pv. oryzae]RBL52601.1 hypothetical protein BRN24_20600 [Xanthomonas oryzae pv. oryzae]
MKSKSMCTAVGLIVMCLAGSAAAAGKPLYQTGPAPSRSAAATDCSGGCPHLHCWSNPNISYNGVPMGNASTADNQRALVNTKATIAGFR